MRSPQIRDRFLDFFSGRGHQVLPSASLLTHDDPTVLFTVAGVVPLKPYILGTRPAPAPRVASCQKCFRGSGLRDDVEEVGDTSHHTFFEMLGNWSFGDYFKEGAITLAWELLTGPYGLAPDRLWPSVHPTDGESMDLWTRVIGVPAERVSRLEENWWQIGPTGPCGYDSEIYYDWGGPCSCGRSSCSPETECGGDRWTEVWNLVFMEFDQSASGARTPLPRPTVDTGMGLERLTAVVQGVRSNYETDLFADIVAGFRDRADDRPDTAARQASINVLADHLRSAAFLIADGVLPSNETRGYALRRVIRRAAVHGRRVGLRGGLAAGLGDLVAVMGEAYPELIERRAAVERALSGEEALFAEKLAEGVERLDALLAGGATRLGGDDAFRLHDTFGFPVDLTVELARERGVTVDRAGFDSAMEEQRRRSKAAVVRVGFEAGPALPPTTFVGYDTLETAATVVHVDARAAGVVIEPSPFYAEAGGQIGDRGWLEADGSRVRVVDTRFLPGTETRVLTLEEPAPWLVTGQGVVARVDAELRGLTARHHSATHLLNQALRRILGDEVAQRGSLVDEHHATFDFSLSRRLTEDEVRSVERMVNEAIRSNHARGTRILAVAEAKAAGAIAMVGERYPDYVRVVSFGDWSVELCGGTHVDRTGDIGAAVIVAESAVGAGVRRIDLVAGLAAERWWEEGADRLRAAARELRASPAELPERVAALQHEVRRLHKEVEDARRLAVGGSGLAAEVETVGGVPLAAAVTDLDARGIQDAADRLVGERLAGGGIALVVGSANAIVKLHPATPDWVDARLLLDAVREVAGGRGGGTAQRAMGSIADPGRRDAAVAAARERLAGLARERNGGTG